MENAVIIIMAKQPQIGKAKTRLCPPLTPKEAADLYEALLLDTLALVSSLEGVDLAVAITPPHSQPYFEQITPPGSFLLPIEGRDIGECLSEVMRYFLEVGYHKAFALNSDGPSLPLEYLRQAIVSLDQCDLVIGPGHDGGYYLIGMRQPAPGIFQGIAWSTDQVLLKTLEQADKLGLQVSFTPEWYDVDTLQDLHRLLADLQWIPLDRLVHTRRFLTDFNRDLSMT